MTIELKGDCLRLNISALEPSEISQLKFWGFQNSTLNSLEFCGDGIDKILIKAISFFNKKGITYTLTDECSAKLNFLVTQTEKFNTIKKIGEDFKNGLFDRNQFKEFDSFLKETLPTRKLKDHQLKAAFHLYLLANGANFSVPGSGKTTVVLSVYEKCRAEGKVNVLFVVGPPACFGPWKNEFAETLGRSPSYKMLAGGDKESRKNEYFANSENKYELYLTTFQTLINDQQEINTFFSQRDINVFLVIDEAHYIKQVNGNWAKAVLNVSEHSVCRCILTGTPMPKSFSDVYNLFDFLWPQNEPIESSSRVRLQNLEKSNNLDDARTLLEQKVGALFYRVRKSDLGLKPAKFHEPIIIPMNENEKLVYEAIERKIRGYAMDDYLKNIDFIDKLKRGRMMRLRQCVSYLHLLSTAIENYEEDLFNDNKDLRYIVREYDHLEIPAKFQYLEQLVQNLHAQGQKVVIWTNFVGTIEKLEAFFTKTMNLRCRSIYGKTPIEQTTIGDELTREQIRDEFVNPHSGLNILLANPAACAESISLHKTCHHAIYYDLTYNCAQYLQSLDRIHRVGGSETIEANYYFLQYENSIDLDILNNLRRKSDKMSKIIDRDYTIYSMDMFDDEDAEISAYDRIFGKEK